MGCQGIGIIMVFISRIKELEIFFQHKMRELTMN